MKTSRSLGHPRSRRRTRQTDTAREPGAPAGARGFTRCRAGRGRTLRAAGAARLPVLRRPLEAGGGSGAGAGASPGDLGPSPQRPRTRRTRGVGGGLEATRSSPSSSRRRQRLQPGRGPGELRTPAAQGGGGPGAAGAESVPRAVTAASCQRLNAWPLLFEVLGSCSASWGCGSLVESARPARLWIRPMLCPPLGARGGLMGSVVRHTRSWA